MTEWEWLICENPQTMLALLYGKTTRRKLQLFAVNCCRRAIFLLANVPPTCFALLCKAIEAAEHDSDFAEPIATHHDLYGDYMRDDAIRDRESKASVKAADRAFREFFHWNRCWQYGETREEYQRICMVANDIVDAVKYEVDEGRKFVRDAERSHQADLLRDIFGNPFRCITLDSECQIPTVKSLAQAIYDERNFARVPILADALEEAGCQQEDVLRHLRSGGEHVRGCWALDLILGKS